MSTMTVLDSAGSPQTVEKPLTPGRSAAATSRPIVLSTEDLAAINALATALGAIGDSAWASGNGSLVALLKAIAANAISTSPSPVEVGPFTPKEIAASQTNAVLGATGAAGDYLSHLIIQPATTSPGVVTLFDGSTGGTNVTVYSFPGGASSLTNLAPIIIPLPANCVNIGWHVTTGANVAVTAVGRFT